MTDYYPLIARAVEGLETNTGEARRALYERARTALVTQLRSVEPALPETDITKERLALEDAIRKVEAEAARKSRVESREPRTAPPPPQRDRPICAGRCRTQRRAANRTRRAKTAARDRELMRVPRVRHRERPRAAVGARAPRRGPAKA